MIKTGLVLSGGSARGIVHLGVIKCLNEMGIRAEAVSGVSAGGIIGALYLAGYPPEVIMRLIVDNKFYTWTKFLWRSSGLLAMEKVEKLLAKYLPATFEELNGKLFITATDIMTGEPVHFSSGNLLKPVCASAAIPLIFAPVKHEGRVLLDGGIVNNFATEPLEGVCEKTIGVHVNHMGLVNAEFGMRDIMDRAMHLAISEAVRKNQKRCTVFIEPPDMHRFNPLSLSKSDEMFKAGYDYAVSRRADIEALLR